MVESPAPIQWKGRAARALFAVLALHPGEPVSRDRLAGLLWAEKDQQAARGSLRMALLSLRRILDPIDPGLISATNETITLNVEQGSVDSALFESLCARSDVEVRFKALELYRGDLKAVFSVPHEAVSELLRDRGERLREIAIETGVDLLSIFENNGERNRARSVAHRLLTIESANEPAHRALMRAHAAAGDRAAMLRQYEQCCAAILEEYDIGPSAETIALRDEFVGSEDTNPAGPDARSGESAGGDAVMFRRPPSHRMKTGRRNLLLAILALVALAVAVRTALPCGLLWRCADDDASAVIVLAPIEFVETDRRVADIADDITEIFEQTLNRIPGAIVIPPAPPERSPAPPVGGYLVKATVEGEDRGLRVYVSLLDRRSGDPILRDRFPIGIGAPELIADELEERLIPELRSRIGLDPSPN